MICWAVGRFALHSGTVPAQSQARRALIAALLVGVAGCGPKGNRPAQRDDRFTIGVPLPLSGKLKAYGEGCRDAVRLAAGELEKAPDRRVRVVVRDSKGESAGASKAVEDLVTIDGATAIVGPIFRAEAASAAERAQDLGVPLVALSADAGVTRAGDFVFQAGISPELELDALVAHAMGTLGMKSFAVLHPRAEYGERLVKLFCERVERRGGAVRKIVSYGSEDTTFTDPIRQLVHLDALAGREDYQRAIQKCKEQPDAYRRARCEREAQHNVPPIIEFEGLFIPDGYKNVSLVALALAAEDVVVERDPEMLQRIEKALRRKVQPITLLGTSAWNSPELTARAGRSVENAIFPGVLLDGSDDAAARELVAGFRGHFARRPDLQEALLYDAVRFVRKVLAVEHPATAAEVREALRTAPAVHGATGDLSFNDGAEARRVLPILTVKGQAIRVASAGRVAR